MGELPDVCQQVPEGSRPQPGGRRHQQGGGASLDQRLRLLQRRSANISIVFHGRIDKVYLVILKKNVELVLVVHNPR